ncbi:HCL509Wp [Eremothecium sinecaudum]|uniref:HCL509Wp n=1 Tax=Eremothecium sinecaudum TaxID=45286 RepID=A0A109UYT5_9SACH|nr:HCL509Wp [Eremothecium sinecaudum]AMD19642.1 HCL509Wp [Eremothecium sinecaudum]
MYNHGYRASLYFGRSYTCLRLLHNKSTAKMTFEGNTKEIKTSAEERMKGVFGNRLKGEPPKSSSRMLVQESRVIGGVTVPAKPIPPDNCCMSGCVQCVWLLYNDDVHEWRSKRKMAAEALKGTNIIWPVDFNPPLRLLDIANVPISLRKKKLDLEERAKKKTVFTFPKREQPPPQDDTKKEVFQETQEAQEAQEANEEDGEWDNVPTFIKTFTEFEKKKTQKQA